MAAFDKSDNLATSGTAHDDQVKPVIAVLGAGKIGEALMSGLLHGGHTADELLFTERHPERSAELTDAYGIRSVEIEEAAERADVLVVAVKPQDIEPLLEKLRPLMTPGKLVVTLCAGLSTTLFENRLGDVPVVRVMPNTPMVVGEAMSAISAGAYATPDHMATVEKMLSCVGQVVELPESQLNAVTALSGSGPAYFFYLVEAMIDAGILLGLPRAIAEKLIIQSAVGSAKMLSDSDTHPVILREAVTSPAGTTINAIRELEKHGVRAALLAAIEAARDRAVELGKAHE
ncbi:pyrroline-5-carboxylate reductase [Haloechinothrix halophila]|uniref:Pyrroline-5-carboxylate reductase n=1 Tax=Haloechinothrix halophila YIM 93223 TaxID=592678 RepID=W9DM76_9PSEU|nr:pyrroline-5-carboxylate reductase [Haloechinothrix halophila]ETA66529.1 pyrroline-5-carboxylate reductase [Haloechinothrix halophila YIM 93223]